MCTCLQAKKAGGHDGPSLPLDTRQLTLERACSLSRFLSVQRLKCLTVVKLYALDKNVVFLSNNYVITCCFHRLSLFGLEEIHNEDTHKNIFTIFIEVKLFFHPKTVILNIKLLVFPLQNMLFHMLVFIFYTCDFTR